MLKHAACQWPAPGRSRRNAGPLQGRGRLAVSPVSGIRANSSTCQRGSPRRQRGVLAGPRLVGRTVSPQHFRPSVANRGRVRLFGSRTTNRHRELAGVAAASWFHCGTASRAVISRHGASCHAPNQDTTRPTLDPRGACRCLGRTVRLAELGRVPGLNGGERIASFGPAWAGSRGLKMRSPIVATPRRDRSIP